MDDLKLLPTFTADTHILIYMPVYTKTINIFQYMNVYVLCNKKT